MSGNQEIIGDGGSVGMGDGGSGFIGDGGTTFVKDASEIGDGGTQI